MRQVILCLLLLTACKSASQAKLRDVYEDQILDERPNPGSANANGLKLSSSYRIDIVCLPSLTGKGLADIERSCSATKKYIALQCGAEFDVQIHDNPDLKDVAALSKQKSATESRGFWLVEAHGAFDESVGRGINQLYQVDKYCGDVNLMETTSMLTAIRASNDKGVWVAACHAEIKNPAVKNVGYSAARNEKSSNVMVRSRDNSVNAGPDFSVVHLIDRLCSISASTRDLDHDGILTGAELGAALPEGWTEVLTLEDFATRAKDIPEKYVLLSRADGFDISKMRCKDRLGRWQILQYRYDEASIFFETEDQARESFAKHKFTEYESNVSALPKTVAFDFPDRDPDIRFIDRNRIADDFPRRIRVGRRANDLEVLSDCEPLVRRGVKVSLRLQWPAFITLKDDASQHAIPADFQLELPLWK